MDVMNLWTVRFASYWVSGRFGGWIHDQQITKGISFCSYDPEYGLAFLSVDGALLLENGRKITTSKVIKQAYFTRKDPRDFETKHICRVNCKKVLWVLSRECADVRDLLVLVTFESDFLLSFEDALARLRIKEDSIVNYSANQILTSNGTSLGYYVQFIVFHIPNKHRTAVISDNKYLYNDNGVLKMLN